MLLNVQEIQLGSPCEWWEALLSRMRGLALAILLALVANSPASVLAQSDQIVAPANLQSGTNILSRFQKPSTQELKVALMCQSKMKSPPVFLHRGIHVR